MTPLRFALAPRARRGPAGAAMAASATGSASGSAELQHHAMDAREPGRVVHRSTGAVADAVYLRSQALQLDLIAP